MCPYQMKPPWLNFWCPNRGQSQAGGKSTCVAFCLIGFFKGEIERCQMCQISGSVAKYSNPEAILAGAGAQQMDSVAVPMSGCWAVPRWSGGCPLPPGMAPHTASLCRLPPLVLTFSITLPTVERVSLLENNNTQDLMRRFSFPLIRPWL